MDYDEINLHIDEAKLNFAMTLLEHSIGYDYSVYMIYNELARSTQLNLVTRETLSKCFKDNMKVQLLFDIMDRHQNQVIELSEICIALAPMCCGNVKEKLRFGFYALRDNSSTCTLTYRNLWVLIRCLIFGIFSVFDIAADFLGTEQLAVDIVATFKAQRSSADDFDGTTTFYQFWNWVTDRNSSNTKWFELLNLRLNEDNRWEGLPSDGLDCNSQLCPFQVSLELGSLYSGGRLALTSFTQLVQSFRLSDMQANIFNSVYKALSEIFCDDDIEEIPYFALSVGLSVFCRGSKSSKLDFAFRSNQTHMRAHMQTPAHSLDEDQLRTLLTVYLCSLKIAASYSTISNSFLESLGASDYLTLASDSVRRALVFVGGDCLSFDEFGDWYNSGGFEIAPWIEMINLSKWIVRATPLSPQSSTPPTSSPQISAHQSHKVEGSGESDIAFVVPFYSSSMDPFAMGVPRSDELFQEVNRIFEAFSPLDFDDLMSLISMADDGLLDANSIGIFSKSLSSSTANHLALYAISFHSFLGGVGSDDSTPVCFDASEFAIGCAVFIDGSKSHKLAFAFEILDATASGYMNRRQLWKLFRSLLLAIISLCECFSKSSLSERYAEHLNSTSLWLAESVISSAPHSYQRQVISFADLADWYSSVGHKVASWLELLDNRKWRFISSTYYSLA